MLLTYSAVLCKLTLGLGQDVAFQDDSLAVTLYVLLKMNFPHR